ncbi:MAG: GAF domain-containing protein [Anaerolineae bacterium]
MMEKELPSTIAWTFLDKLTEGVILAESSGSVLYVNQATRLLLGLEQDPFTLSAIGATTTPPGAWQTILAAPANVRVTTVNGRSLTLHSSNCSTPDSSLIQILISPGVEPEEQQAAGLPFSETLHTDSEALARGREARILFEASRAISGTLDKDEILSLMGEHMLRASRADGYTIYRWKPQDNTLSVLKDYCVNLSQETAPPGTSVPLEEFAPVHEVLTTLKLFVIQSEAILATTWRPPWLAEGLSYISSFLPIVVAEEPFGVVEVISQTNASSLAPAELQLLNALSNQASTALETAFIFEETYERERFYSALGRVSLAMNYALDRKAVLDLIARESLPIFNVDGVYIWLKEGDEFVGHVAKGRGEAAFPGTRIAAADNAAFVASVANRGEAIYVNHIQQNRSVTLHLPQASSVGAVLGVPLAQEGNILGCLVLADTRNSERFREKDVTQATTFAVQVAIALRNASLFEELRRFNEELDQRVAERTQALHEESNRVKVLLRITSELSASLDQDRVLSQGLKLVNEVVGATEGQILLIDQETNELLFRAAVGAEMKLPPKGIPSGLMRDEGLPGWMIKNRSAVIVHDTRDDPRWRDHLTYGDHRSVLGVPLITNEEVIGVLMLFHPEPSAFTMQELDLVEAAAIQVANAVNNASLYLLIRDQAERLGSMLRAEQIEAAKNQSILESIADGVLVADDHSRIILANMPASSILDIPRQQLIGKSINELLGLYGQPGESWLNTIRDWAENADRIQPGSYLSDQLTIEDKVVSVSLSPVLAGRQFFGTVSIFRDITKEVEVDQLKSEFVSTVSHELRTPMTSIKGYADLMLMGAAGPMSDPQIRYLNVIKNNADRLHLLVNDLLDISRIETGKTTLDLRPLDVGQLVEQVVDGHLRGRIQHANKEIQVRVDITPTLPLVNADHARVTQILTNLIDNALNYTPGNGRIQVRAWGDNQFVHISIQDTGIGISEENLNKIFDRFFRAESAIVQKVPGTGLGLAIVRSLIEMHGGELKVESKLGEGSTFTFNLPVVVEDSDPA